METTESGVSSKNTEKSKKDVATWKFVEAKKKEMKKSQYRQRFDRLFSEIDSNLVNTLVSYGTKLYEQSGWGSMVFYNKMENGAYDINVYPQRINEASTNRTGVPVAAEPIAFAKILIATSIMAGKLPDADVISDSKVYSTVAHKLWKRTWTNRGGNGANTLMVAYQNLFTYGWTAWRAYPRRVQIDRSGVQKIIFDDIYREGLDPTRTWLGIGFSMNDYWSQFEVYYEKDLPKDLFFSMYPAAAGIKNKKKYLDWTDAEKQQADAETDTDISEEARDENPDKSFTHVTIGYYENPLLNRYVVKCGKLIIYDGEIPNDDGYGSVVVARCFMRKPQDPYGVGMYELMRGNTAIYTYINSLNAQQVEAEIFPLLFGTQVQNGTGVYKRGPNIVNPKNPGSEIDVVNTKGNIQGGIAYANQQKTDIEENTGINNIVAGQNTESTLGSTVILKEAAYNRLTAPRNSMVDALGMDALISWSWIRQTYSVDKVFMIDSKDQVKTFLQQNPDYFVETQPVVNDEKKATGKYIAAASKNLRLDFDFTPDGQVLDKVDTRKVSARQLFSDLEEHGQTSDYIEFLIDPDSMLLPSMEIQKQTFMALFPVIANQITMVFNLRLKDPDAAASQLMTLEKMLEIQKQDIFDFIPKLDYDEIMAKKPSEAQLKMIKMMQPPKEVKPPSETLNYKDAPEDVKREIEAQAGLEPSRMAPGGRPASPVAPKPGDQPGNAPIEAPVAPEDMGGAPSIDPAGTDALQPQNPGEVARPQAPMTAAMDGSLGQAANLPFFPATG